MEESFRNPDNAKEFLLSPDTEKDTDSLVHRKGKSQEYHILSNENAVKEDIINETSSEDDNNRKSVLRNVAGFIIVTEFCERLVNILDV